MNNKIDVPKKSRQLIIWNGGSIFKQKASDIKKIRDQFNFWSKHIALSSWLSKQLSSEWNKI
jgi:hypothetical protein